MSERAVWKWTLRPMTVNRVPMPEGAKIVHVGQGYPEYGACGVGAR